MTDANAGGSLRDVTRGRGTKRRGETSQAPWPDGEKRNYFIEFSRSLLREDRSELQHRFHLALERYFPTYTYLESIDWPTLQALRAHPLVTAAYPFEPGDNIAPISGDKRYRTASRQGTEGQIFRATLFPDTDLAAVEAQLNEIEGVTTRRLDNGSLQRVLQIELAAPNAEIPDRMAEIEGIDWIEEVPEAIPDSGTHADLVETGVPNSAPFTGHGLRGQGQTIAVIDKRSLDLGHCWFKDPALAPPNPIEANHRKVVAIYDQKKGGIGRHATFVAGILAGDHLPHANASPVRGVAFAAKMVYANRDDFQDHGATATLYDYLEKVSLNGGDPAIQAYIISNSWHLSSNPPYLDDSVAVDRFMWTYEDRLVIGSTGNTGDDMGPPGTAKNALCVGAAYVDAKSSCFADGRQGPTLDGQRRKPDLLGPGCDTESANLSSAAVPCNISTDQAAFGGSAAVIAPLSVSAYCRTSFATPVVAAAAAIVRQYFVEGRHPTGYAQPANRLHPTAALLKAVLVNASEKPSSSSSSDYPLDTEGWGVLRLNRILRLPGGSRKFQCWDVRNDSGAGLFTGESVPRTLTVRSNRKPLRVTLVWTDAPGERAIANPAVNDLDLTVTSPSGTMYRGNVFNNGFSATGGTADTQNNVEMVVIQKPDAGDWTITVTAREVNVGNQGQGYALVARGDIR